MFEAEVLLQRKKLLLLEKARTLCIASDVELSAKYEYNHADAWTSRQD